MRRAWGIVIAVVVGCGGESTQEPKTCPDGYEQGPLQTCMRRDDVVPCRCVTDPALATCFVGGDALAQGTECVDGHLVCTQFPGSTPIPEEKLCPAVIGP